MGGKRSRMIYLTSDSHHSHFNIIRYTNRPFSSVEEMNETLIENWNSIITNNDIVYHLGDFSMSFGPIKYILPRLNRKELYLIHGNHDQTFRKWNKFYPVYRELGFTDIYKEWSLTIDNETLVLNHFPWTNEDPRFQNAKPKKPWGWELTGHRHLPKDQIIDYENKLFDVGIDGHDYYPWSIEEILEKIK